MIVVTSQTHESRDRFTLPNELIQLAVGMRERLRLAHVTYPAQHQMTPGDETTGTYQEFERVDAQVNKAMEQCAVALQRQAVTSSGSIQEDIADDHV